MKPDKPAEKIVEDFEDVEDDIRHESLVTVADDVISAISMWEVNSWVVVKFGRQWLPGQITCTC